MEIEVTTILEFDNLFLLKNLLLLHKLKKWRQPYICHFYTYTAPLYSCWGKLSYSNFFCCWRGWLRFMFKKASYAKQIKKILHMGATEFLWFYCFHMSKDLEAPIHEFFKFNFLRKLFLNQSFQGCLGKLLQRDFLNLLFKIPIHVHKRLSIATKDPQISK